MRFRVENQPNNSYAIVPEGREPLPALFDNREHAQRLADKLCQRAASSHNTRRELGHGSLLAVS
jgi:hypothetical protein